MALASSRERANLLWDHGRWWFLAPKNQLNIYFVTSMQYRLVIAKLKKCFQTIFNSIQKVATKFLKFSI